MTHMTPTIIIVDDDPSARRGLSRLITAAGMQVEVYESARQFLSQADRERYNCLVLDVKMPGMTGIELQDALIKEENPLSIIFISGDSDISVATSVMKKGAVDFLTKPIDQNKLFSAIDRALKKNRSERKLFDDQTTIRNRVGLLTPREYTILTYVISGMPNKKIATSLGITEDTVKKHRGRVMKKMAAESYPKLLRLAELVSIEPAKSIDL